MEEELSSSSSSSVEKRNWSELPSDLLDIIMDKLSGLQLLSDYIRFGAVCDSWNSAYCDHDPPSHQFPTLVLVVPPSTRNNKKKEKKTWLHRFYNVSDEKIDGALKEVRMPSYSRGSSHGWLITVDDDDEDSNFAVRLFNPFLSTNGIEILLPSLNTLTIKPGFDVRLLRPCTSLLSAVLSANPLTNPTDYTAMAIYGICSSLAFFKPGNKRWTSIEAPEIKSSRPDNFTQVLYCHMYGKFFAVNWDGAVVAVSDDVGEQGGMIAKLVIQAPLPDKIFKKKYLIIESSGRELLKVHRFISKYKGMDMDLRGTYATTGFSVFKLKVTTGGGGGGGAKEEEEYYEWQEVKSLCGDSMFLGYNTSISIRASDYPGCKPDSIHYTDDYDALIRMDIGIFNLEDGSFNRRHVLPIAPKNIAMVVWIQSSLPNKNRRRSSSC